MPTVLVVDDEASIRRLVSRILARRGYIVHEAEDDLAACYVVQTLHGKLDLLLIVTDSTEPKLNGISLARKITAEYPAITVLYISGYTASPPKDHPSLAKPFTPSELVEMVETILGVDSGHPKVANAAQRLQMPPDLGPEFATVEAKLNAANHEYRWPLEIATDAENPGGGVALQRATEGNS